MINQNQRKRQFLSWVLQHYCHEDQMVNYILEFLMTQPDLIQYVVFSEEVQYAPRGIYISYQQHTAVPFLYYKDKRSYTSCEQAFHDLRLNAQFAKATFYVELNIPEYNYQTLIHDVFDENPFCPLDAQLVAQVDDALDQIGKITLIKQVQRDLDLALDEGRYEEANALLHQLDQLKGEQNER